MRKSQLKKMLPAAFAAPEPTGARAFFRRMGPVPAGMGEFLLVQAGYIRKRVWVLAAAVFALGLVLRRAAGDDAAWVLSALTPFAALTAITEQGRSALYGMEELELAARSSLKSVVLARMGVLALAHGVLLALLTPLTGLGPLRAGAYLLTPYLLTTALGLAALRRFRGREGQWACGGAAALVAGLDLAAHAGESLFRPERLGWWLAALALSAALAGREYQKTIHETEELSWSL